MCYFNGSKSFFVINRACEKTFVIFGFLLSSLGLSKDSVVYMSMFCSNQDYSRGSDHYIFSVSKK